MVKSKGIEHPGYPRIGAIQLFRKNVKQELNSAENVFDEEVQNIKGFRSDMFRSYSSHQAARNAQQSFRLRKDNESPIRFNAFFDKVGLMNMMEHINKEIEEAGKKAMVEGMRAATDKTSKRVASMGRRFKSRYRPRTADPNDIYNAIAWSLDFDETTHKQGRFVSFIAGSNEDKTKYSFSQQKAQDSWSENTAKYTGGGIRGRRMKNYPGAHSLVELTEEGVNAYTVNTNKIAGWFAGIRKNPAARLRAGISARALRVASTENWME